MYSIGQFFLSMQILRTHTNLVIAIRQFLYFCQILIFCHNLFMPKQRSKKAKPKIVLTENMYLEVIFQVLQLTHFARFSEFPVYGFTGVLSRLSCGPLKSWFGKGKEIWEELIEYILYTTATTK